MNEGRAVGSDCPAASLTNQFTIMKTNHTIGSVEWLRQFSLNKLSKYERRLYAIRSTNEAERDCVESAIAKLKIIAGRL